MCYICMRECLGSTTTPKPEGKGMDSEGDYNVLSCSFGKDGEDNKENAMETGGEGDKESTEKGCTEHRRYICSRCCVEKGDYGEVTCLGCLRAEKVG